jgi:RNA polymerase subunit RPABC4/transcription elongation factor Spt4
MKSQALADLRRQPRGHFGHCGIILANTICLGWSVHSSRLAFEFGWSEMMAHRVGLEDDWDDPEGDDDGHMVACPHCHEEVYEEAEKCPRCGQYILPEGAEDEWNNSDDDEDTVECPHCQKYVHEESEQCPHCGQYISEEDQPPRRKPWWIILGVAACLYVVYRWITR